MQFTKSISLLLVVALIAICAICAEAGKNKGKGEDIILYKGNIVMRGEKKGGSIVVANAEHSEHVEMDPMSYYMPYMMGGHGHGHGRR